MRLSAAADIEQRTVPNLMSAQADNQPRRPGFPIRVTCGGLRTSLAEESGKKFMLALQIIGYLIFLLIWLGVGPYFSWTITCIFRSTGISFELSVIIGNIFELLVPVSILIVWIVRRIQRLIRWIKLKKQVKSET